MDMERYDFPGVKHGKNARIQGLDGRRRRQGQLRSKQLLRKHKAEILGFVDEDCGCDTRVHKRSVWTPNSELSTSARQSPKNIFLPKLHLLFSNPFAGPFASLASGNSFFIFITPRKHPNPPTSHNGTDSSPLCDNPRAPQASLQFYGRQRRQHPIRPIQRGKNSKLRHRTSPAPQVDARRAPSAEAAPEEPRAQRR